MFYRILIRRHPTLRHHCGKGYQEDNRSCHCYPGPPRDTIGVSHNPVAHEIQQGTEMTNAIITYMRNVRTSRRRIWALVEPNTLRTAISFCRCSMK